MGWTESGSSHTVRRILPPYWAALGFSLVMTWYVLAQPGWALPNGKSVVVYGLLAAAVVTSRPRFVVRVLTTRMTRILGSCSYSLYLTHAPIVIAVFEAWKVDAR